MRHIYDLFFSNIYMTCFFRRTYDLLIRRRCAVLGWAAMVLSDLGWARRSPTPMPLEVEGNNLASLLLLHCDI